MYSTVETRWFGRGEVPAAVLAWFNACPGNVELQPVRQDHYLRLDEDDGLSVKVRDGGLEIKQRRCRYGLVPLTQSVFGLVEGWTKWRFPLEDPKSLPLDSASGVSAWLAVNKERQLRRYQLIANQDIQPTVPEETISAGCELEFAVLRAGGDLWWTVAFEAFGESAGNHARLLKVASTLLDRLAPHLLPSSESYSYSHLLSGLAGNH
jgi:hypothetical protein